MPSKGASAAVPSFGVVFRSCCLLCGVMLCTCLQKHASAFRRIALRPVYELVKALLTTVPVSNFCHYHTCVGVLHKNCLVKLIHLGTLIFHSPFFFRRILFAENSPRH
ncbi:hypothetical protein TRVL_07667 [Trypanosoma vivax]|nr:hypothetical protein TRVL_07667 [Trypanosoma vivax]